MPWLDAAWHPGGGVDGPLIPFDPADRGLLLGDGVFDTSLVLGRRMVWRAAHVARLHAAGRALGFSVDPTAIEAAIDGVLADAANEHGSLRLTVTRGPGPRGLAPPADAHPTIVATLFPLRTSALFAPLRLHVSEIRRNETSPTSRLKSLAYLDAVLAASEALRAGCDDALFLNSRGSVACAGVGNLFAVCGSELLTPPLADGVLAGITRAVLLDKCEELGLAPVERSLGLDDLYRADAIIVTNSLRLIAPVSSIGKRAVGGSLRGAALATLVAKAVTADVGCDPRSLAET